MPFVLDASTTLAHLLPDEASDEADRVFERFLDDDAIVPPIWVLEVANALLMAERRGRLPVEVLDPITRALAALPVRVEGATSEIIPAILATARQYRLSAYDASYLHLSLARGFPLATVDGPLGAAAERAGVRLRA